MPAKIMLERMLACAYPPRSEPTSDVAKRTMRSVMFRRAQHVAHQDEQRRRDERKRVHRLRHLLRHDRRRQPAEATNAKPPAPMDANSGMPTRMASSQTRDDLQIIRWIIRSAFAAASSRSAAPRRVSTSFPQPLHAVTTPASTMGTYIHAMEIGSVVASRSTCCVRRGTRPHHADQRHRRLIRDLDQQLRRAPAREGIRSWKKRMRTWMRLRLAAIQPNTASQTIRNRDSSSVQISGYCQRSRQTPSETQASSATSQQTIRPPSDDSEVEDALRARSRNSCARSRSRRSYAAMRSHSPLPHSTRTSPARSPAPACGSSR